MYYQKNIFLIKMCKRLISEQKGCVSDEVRAHEVRCT